jgi:5-methylcytosine-specific restriction endonuclease McrBC regulatory subunit McrC
VNASLYISVPERGHADIDGKAWEVLSSHNDFWRLVDQKILSPTLISSQKIRLTGSCFVGRVILNSCILEVGEKIDGSLAALLGYATFNAFRVEKYDAPASALGPLLALLVHHFLGVLRAYVSLGREFRYESMGMRGSLVGGRINITKTIGFRARGLQHVLAFDRPVLTHVTPKNRVIAAAVSEVERVSEIITLDVTDLAMARGLSLLFEDCKDTEVLFGTRDAFVRVAQRLILSANETDRDLLALASVILAHQSFDYGSPAKAISPRAWFLNLEKLFEVAVRQVLGSVYAPGTVRSRAAAEFESRIFDKASEEYKANPDLILSDAEGVQAIGDVKYKLWDESADVADMYQLLVHAVAYHAPRAFLVFPHDCFMARDLGVSVTGCHTWLFAVDVRNLQEHLQLALSTMGQVRRG